MVADVRNGSQGATGAGGNGTATTAAAVAPAPSGGTRDPKQQKQRQQALQSALGQIEKQFGKGSIMTLGQSEKIHVEGISTGSLSLDLALGGFGIPRGRITEIYGPESSGKTTLCLHVIANAQRAGGVCAFIDAEHAFDATYARHLGINLDELLISQPDTGEQALEIAETLIRSNAIDVIVIDSVAALVPKAEIEGEMGDSHVGLQARLMSQALRKLSGAIRTSNAVMIFTNQIRMKIGVMFGSPETTTGGNALKFYASVRIDMRRIGSLKGPNDAVIGNRTRAKVVKNKIAPPFRLAEFDVLFGKGIDRLGDVVDLASNAGVIDKSGAWLSWKEHRLGQGRDKAREFLVTQPDLVASIEKETVLAVAGKEGAGLPTTASVTEEGGEAPAAAKPPERATKLGGTEVAEPTNRLAAGAAGAKAPEAPAAGPGPETQKAGDPRPGELKPAATRPAQRPAPVVTKKTLPARPLAQKAPAPKGR